MDAPNAEAREYVGCPVCGEVHLECSEAILEGMEFMALLEAKARLSSEGMETLSMIGHAAETLPGGLLEAWDLAENVKSLPENDFTNLVTYFDRISLIDFTREELYEVYDHE